MLFGVKLIEVPKISTMSGLQVWSLFVNCRHIAGDLWCFEGDDEALPFNVGILSEGAIDSSHESDYDDEAFVKKCTEVFDWDFTGMGDIYQVGI